MKNQKIKKGDVIQDINDPFDTFLIVKKVKNKILYCNHILIGRECKSETPIRLLRIENAYKPMQFSICCTKQIMRNVATEYAAWKGVTIRYDYDKWEKLYLKSQDTLNFIIKLYCNGMQPVYINVHHCEKTVSISGTSNSRTTKTNLTLHNCCPITS